MTPRKTTLARRVDALMADATTLTALIDPALAALDVAASGWPTQTPGANPASPPAPTVLRYDEDGNPINDTSTSTERAALNLRGDPAARDRKALDRAVQAAGKQLALAAIIASKWATPALNDHTIAKRLAAVDAGIWCENCSTHGHKNPRRPDGRHCDFCAGFKSDWKQYPPKDVLDIRTIKGRIYDSDIRRILARVRDQRKGVA